MKICIQLDELTEWWVENVWKKTIKLSLSLWFKVYLYAQNFDILNNDQPKSLNTIPTSALRKTLNLFTKKLRLP